MSKPSNHEEKQLFARLTVLEMVVGMIISDSILKSGKGPKTFSVSECVKVLMKGRAPKGATDTELSEAADTFVSRIESQIGGRAGGLE